MALFLFILYFIYTTYVLSRSFSGNVKCAAVLLGTILYLGFGGSWLVSLLAFIIAGGSLYVCYNSAFRKKYLTAFFYEFLKKQLPPISETERIALEAGDSSVEADIFQAKTDFERHYRLTDAGLTEEERDFINNKVDRFCHEVNDWDINTKWHDLPKKAWEILREERLLGLVIPKEYGGHGFSALAHSTIVNKIASRSGTAAVSVMVPNSLGPGELLLHYGTEKQKQYYLPRLAKGEEIPCFGLTSTFAGSDATSIKDRGVICRKQIDGKEVLGINLTFEKRYITLAPIATLIGLAFKLFDPEHLLGNQEELGITLALIPRKTPGLKIGNRHYPMLLSFMNGSITGKDVFIPMDFIIGGEAQIGRGWQMLMECLSIGRGISIPALGNATSKFSYLVSSAYAAVREQFGLSISDFEGVQNILGKLGGLAYISEAQRRLTLNVLDQGQRPSLLSAISKLHLSEFGRESINMAFDIHGGKAIQMGPKNYLGWGYLAIPVAITVEGANVLTRNLIIFGQGLIRCHPYIKSLIDNAYQEESDAVLTEFDRHLQGYVGYVIKNASAVLLNHFSLGLQEYSLCKEGVRNACRRHQVLSHKLALLSDLCLMYLGGKLKFKEATSARLGDALSYLTLHYSTINYYISHQSADDAVYFEWASAYCLHKAEAALLAVIENMPARAIRLALKLIVFPLGRMHAAPTDKMDIAIAKLSKRQHDFRDRVKNDAYPSDVLVEIEAAFKMREELEGVLKLVKKAVKIGQIDETLTFESQIIEAKNLGIIDDALSIKLKEYAQYMHNVVAVDEFESLSEVVIQEIA